MPATLPIREEVISAMCLALCEGRLLAKDIRGRVGEFVRAQWRQFSKFGPLSLDAPVFEDGSATLGDTITRGLWD